MRHWLMKSEPEVFSIDDLKTAPDSLWDGVRNYQARNFMTRDMQLGDEILFYHSNANPSGVAGRAKVSGLAQPDPSQFNKKSEYYDPKAKPDAPIWFGVQLRFVERFAHVVTLEELRRAPKLKDMLVLKKGQRLSIQPVSASEFAAVCALGREKST